MFFSLSRPCVVRSDVSSVGVAARPPIWHPNKDERRPTSVRSSNGAIRPLLIIDFIILTSIDSDTLKRNEKAK